MLMGFDLWHRLDAAASCVWISIVLLDLYLVLASNFIIRSDTNMNVLFTHIKSCSLGSIMVNNY